MDKTISGMLVKSRTPGPRGGTTYTVVDRDRTHSITLTDFTDFHLENRESYQNVTVTVTMDFSNSKKVELEQPHE